MSSLFDVDCPRTPDGDSKEEPPQPQRMQKKRNTPPMAPTKPPRISRKDPRNKSTSSSSSRSRSTPRRVGGGGLEPEEYIAPTKNGIEVLRMARSPSSGNAALHNNRPRAFSSGGTGSYPSRVPSAPSSGPSRYVPPRAPSSGPSAYTAAPNSGGLAGNDISGSHPRTNSGDWWKEEITDESENKDVLMDKHYGLSSQEHQHFYGKSNTNPFEADDTYFGNPGAREIDINQEEDEEAPDAEKGLDSRMEAERVLAAVENRNHHRDNLHSSLFDQANQMRHAGYYHNEDDYSFNHVNLSDVPISPRDVGSPPIRREKKANVRNNLMPKWFGVFSPKAFHMTSETNIAPRSSSEWLANSSNVSFDTSFNPNGVRKRGVAGHWDRLSPAKKVSVGVILVAFMCTILGVAVSETKKSYTARQNAALALAMTSPPSPSPTLQPTNIPTLNPTDRPTRTPISRSPVAGNSGIHGKDSDGTQRPTRMPVTMSPSKSPTVKPSGRPSNSPSLAPSVPVTQKVQAAPACTDVAGLFRNHLGNEKTCEWLDKEEGFSDRKNKNCGTQWPDGSIYPVTDLGANCQRTCALYNECSGLISSRTEEFNYVQPSARTSEMMCQDQPGEFKNHLDTPKTCEWLDNNKPGHTDRKSKNCGWGNYLITELGWNCPQTCSWYNKIGCWDTQDQNSVAGMSVRASSAAGHSSTSTGSHSSITCMNGSGTYENHNGDEESCDWLHTDFRLERNCGFDRHGRTPLGENCPWSCREFNECSAFGFGR